MVEEAARGRGHVDLFADARDFELVEGLHRAVRLALRRAEGGEVMTSNQMRGAGPHCLDIERDGDVPHAPGVERRRRPAAEDSVQITPPEA